MQVHFLCFYLHCNILINELHRIIIHPGTFSTSLHDSMCASPPQVPCLPVVPASRCLTAPPLEVTCTWSKETWPSLSLPSWARAGPSCAWPAEPEGLHPDLLWSPSTRFTSGFFSPKNPGTQTPINTNDTDTLLL